MRRQGKIAGDVMDEWNKESICKVNVNTKESRREKKIGNGKDRLEKIRKTASS